MSVLIFLCMTTESQSCEKLPDQNRFNITRNKLDTKKGKSLLNWIYIYTYMNTMFANKLQNMDKTGRSISGSNFSEILPLFTIRQPTVKI